MSRCSATSACMSSAARATRCPPAAPANASTRAAAARTSSRSVCSHSNSRLASRSGSAAGTAAAAAARVRSSSMKSTTAASSTRRPTRRLLLLLLPTRALLPSSGKALAAALPAHVCVCVPLTAPVALPSGVAAVRVPRRASSLPRAYTSKGDRVSGPGSGAAMGAGVGDAPPGETGVPDAVAVAVTTAAPAAAAAAASTDASSSASGPPAARSGATTGGRSSVVPVSACTYMGFPPGVLRMIHSSVLRQSYRSCRASLPPNDADADSGATPLRGSQPCASANPSSGAFIMRGGAAAADGGDSGRLPSGPPPLRPDSFVAVRAADPSRQRLRGAPTLCAAPVIDALASAAAPLAPLASPPTPVATSPPPPPPPPPPPSATSALVLVRELVACPAAPRAVSPRSVDDTMPATPDILLAASRAAKVAAALVPASASRMDACRRSMERVMKSRTAAASPTCVTLSRATTSSTARRAHSAVAAVVTAPRMNVSAAMQLRRCARSWLAFATSASSTCTSNPTMARAVSVVGSDPTGSCASRRRRSASSPSHTVACRSARCSWYSSTSRASVTCSSSVSLTNRSASASAAAPAATCSSMRYCLARSCSRDTHASAADTVMRGGRDGAATLAAATAGVASSTANKCAAMERGSRAARDVAGAPLCRPAAASDRGLAPNTTSAFTTTSRSRSPLAPGVATMDMPPASSSAFADARNGSTSFNAVDIAAVVSSAPLLRAWLATAVLVVVVATAAPPSSPPLLPPSVPLPLPLPPPPVLAHSEKAANWTSTADPAAAICNVCVYGVGRVVW